MEWATSSSKQDFEKPPLILSVDDQEDNLVLLNYMLETLAYSQISAADGRTALKLSQVYRPALILLDIAMPGMDGFDVMRRLRLDPRTSSIPVIAVTALTMVGDRERILAAGCNDYLSKPYVLEEVDAVINRVLRHFYSVPSSYRQAS